MSIVVGPLACERGQMPTVTVDDRLRPALDGMYNPRHVPVPLSAHGWGKKSGVLFEYYTTTGMRITFYNGIGAVTERWE